jgi:hypothetical protein
MAAIGAAVPALASITYACAPNIDATEAGTCGALNGSTVSGVYSSIFSDVNASIYITYGNTGVGQSSFDTTPVSYAQYYAALPGYSQSLLSPTDPLTLYGNTSGNIDVTSALASALGITANGASTAGVEADGMTACTLGGPGCYNGVITIANGGGFYFPLSPGDPVVLNEVDFFYIVEHETDEILGTSSCIVGDEMDQCTSTDAAPADLFRYAAASIPSFLSTSNGSAAYFSIDGGATAIAYYTNAPGNGDYGDWTSGGPYRVQDGEAHTNSNLDLTNDGGSGIEVLNAVGFGLAVPEPGTLGLAGVSLAILALARSRRRRQS